ncbi:concanavalin A-like lectin/glucanase [Lophium mytilinum]|uniref:chitinase n=1 Tax=Lophium mytilinum TaxID=390894 RepID=A0A6A6RAV8_9PEZI|nr:concanavalin A-like lectin/glucanase [Lophium mytilinum]
MLSLKLKAILCLTLASSTLAQTSSPCNPTTNTTCSADSGLSASTYSIDFTSSSDNNTWTTTAGNVSYTSSGAEFKITKRGDSPTIQTSWYLFFGVIEVHLRAAPGTGIVSSVVLESDDLDEIDWEFLGGNSSKVETNYFGKGNTTSYDRAVYYGVDDAQSTSHNYTVEWTKEYTTWYVDGSAKRTLNYADALLGKNYPQTPMRLKLGIWAGGDSEENSAGTVEWAGGETDYSDGPFTMYVERVKVTNYNPGGSYSYRDQTGDLSSIEVSNATDANSTGGNVSEVTGTTALATGTAAAETSTGTAAAEKTVTTGAASLLSLQASSVVLSMLVILPVIFVA